MKHPVKTAGMVIGLCLALCLPPSNAQTFDHMMAQISTHTLSNGMKWIVYERHDAPVVSFNVHTDVGSANESYDITGISHLLEHLAFKGSQLVGSTDYEKEQKVLDELDRVYLAIERASQTLPTDSVELKKLQQEFDALQAQAKSFVVNNELTDLFTAQGENNMNAGTSTDATVYTNALPSNRLEYWMALTSDRFLHPVFRELYKERNVVIEERRLRTESQPIGRLMEDLMAVAFKAHPYHHSIGGHMSVLHHLTRQDVRDYFNTYYIPSNIVVGVAGDVNPDEVFKLAETYFGRIPSGDKPLPPRAVEPEQWGERHVKVEAQSQPILLVGYHRPAGSHAHDAALGALANIIGQGRSSWLYKELVKEKQLAMQCGAFNGFPGDKYPNLMAFFAVPNEGHTAQECLEAMDAIIERMKNENVTAEELTKYKRGTKKGIIDAMKSNNGMAGALCEAEVKSGSWKAFFKQYDDVQSITAQDIQEMARQYLTTGNRTIAEIVPESKKQGE